MNLRQAKIDLNAIGKSMADPPRLVADAAGDHQLTSDAAALVKRIVHASRRSAEATEQGEATKERMKVEKGVTYDRSHTSAIQKQQAELLRSMQDSWAKMNRELNKFIDRQVGILEHAQQRITLNDCTLGELRERRRRAEINYTECPLMAMKERIGKAANYLTAVKKMEASTATIRMSHRRNDCTKIEHGGNEEGGTIPRRKDSRASVCNGVKIKG